MPDLGGPDLEVVADADEGSLAVEVCEGAEELREEDAAVLVWLEMVGGREEEAFKFAGGGVGEGHLVYALSEGFEEGRGEDHEVFIEALGDVSAGLDELAEADGDGEAAFCVDVVSTLR